MTSIITARAHIAPIDYNKLSDVEVLALVHDHARRIRAEQATDITLGPKHWRSWGVMAGRGFGKTFAIAIEFNRRVRLSLCKRPALIAPTLPRVDQVQIDTLIELAPPWFRPERYDKTIRWPNGVIAECFTPEAPGRSRSSNIDLAWMTEIVDWQRTSRMRAFENLTTAIRTGGAQYFWDSTSSGRNEVIQFLLQQHTLEPSAHRLVRGTMFDNPGLGASYLRSQMLLYVPGSRRFKEEVLGEAFQESAGALWRQAWFDEHRVDFAPAKPELTVVGLDPALGTNPDNDETGLVVCSRLDDHYYVTRDHSGRHSHEQWGDLVVAECLAGAAGVVIERNHIGDGGTSTVRSRAKERGLRVHVLARDEPIRHEPGVILVREVTARNSKGERAQAPAALTSAGRVHVVGHLDALEDQCTTWETQQRGGDSPNRIDALCEAVNELSGALIDTRPAQPKSIEHAAAANVLLQERLRERERAAGGWRLGR